LGAEEMMKKSRTLLLLKWLFLLFGVLFISYGFTSSGWRKPTAIIIGVAELLGALVFWNRMDYPFDPDEPVSGNTKHQH
jgi:hypothetical protein